MKKKQSYDFYLILATTVVLFCISIICVYSMFYFKLAQVNEMQPVAKLAYMNQMNQFISPFLIALIMLMCICVPKRLLPTVWLNRFSLGILVLAGVVTWLQGIKIALLVILVLAMVLQFIVLIMALAGNERLNFEKKGYWVRVGSSAMHLGLILFVLDLFLHKNQDLHLPIFWLTTISTVVGMIGCFYAEGVVGLFKGKR